MDQKGAETIVAWHYEEPYTFYDTDQDAEDLEEFLDPENWPDRRYTIHDDEGDLIGFFSFKMRGETLDIGLGLRPDLTGKGMGLEFVKAGMEYGVSRFHPDRFSLAVATFNQRAIRVYLKAGFERGEIFLNKTNGGEFEFLRMICDV